MGRLLSLSCAKTFHQSLCQSRHRRVRVPNRGLRRGEAKAGTPAGKCRRGAVVTLSYTRGPRAVLA